MSVRILEGDALQVLQTLPDCSVQMCVTSPPYFGLRDYGTATWEGGDESCDHLRPFGTANSSTRGKPSTTFHGSSVAYQGKADISDDSAHAARYRDECGKCGAVRTDHQLGLEKTPDLDRSRLDFFGEGGRNKRSVWTISTSPYSEAHFATFPPKLIEPCILAGSAKGQTVLDPFGGAGTTGLVADRLGRDALLIELNPKYAEMARRRIHSDNPLFGDVA